MGKAMEGDINTSLLMEDVSDKLHILDYERFCKQQKGAGLKPIPRTYFALPASNPNEQLFFFTSLLSWLMGLNGHSFKPPGQFDDPNATAATVVDELKKMGFVTDFPPSKLKQGYGVAVCTVLNALLDRTLELKGFQFRKPVHSAAESNDDLDNVEESEVISDMVVDEAIEEEKDDDVDEEYTLQAISGKEQEIPTTNMVKESTIDPAQWRLEIERVAPLLKVHIVVDHKDWRNHLEQMKQYHGSVGSTTTTLVPQLEKLVVDIEGTLEKISTREKLLNSQFETLVREYKVSQESYLSLNERYKRSSENVTTLTNELAGLVEELEGVKLQMDSRSTDMTDTSPVVNLKKTMSKLKDEIIQMEVRIGVIEHTLLQAKFKSKHPPQNEKQINTHSLGISVEYEDNNDL